MTADLPSRTLFARASGILDARVARVVVLHDPDSDSYMRLNATGAVIWDRLSRPAAVEQLADSLAQRSGLEPADAVSEVERFLADLVQRGAVIRVDAPEG